MKSPALAAAFALLATLTVTFAQTLAPSATPTPAKSNSPFGAGMGMSSKDRPKGAKTEITAKKEATFDNEKNIATFEGSVVVVDPQFNLFCDRLVVTLSPDRKGMKLVEAFGNVIITQENKDDNGKVTKAIGRSGKAVFTPDNGDMTLTEWPSVQHGINQQVATEAGTIMVLNRGGTSKTTGASKTVIVDTGDTKNQ